MRPRPCLRGPGPTAWLEFGHEDLRSASFIPICWDQAAFIKAQTFRQENKTSSQKVQKIKTRQKPLKRHMLALNTQQSQSNQSKESKHMLSFWINN